MNSMPKIQPVFDQHTFGEQIMSSNSVPGAKPLGIRRDRSQRLCKEVLTPSASCTVGLTTPAAEPVTITKEAQNDADSSNVLNRNQEVQSQNSNDTNLNQKLTLGDDSGQPTHRIGQVSCVIRESELNSIDYIRELTARSCVVNEESSDQNEIVDQ